MTRTDRAAVMRAMMPNVDVLSRNAIFAIVALVRARVRHYCRRAVGAAEDPSCMFAVQKVTGQATGGDVLPLAFELSDKVRLGGILARQASEHYWGSRFKPGGL